MTLQEHLQRSPRGEMARLARVAGLDYKTVWSLARKRGYRLDSYSKARALSAATDGAVTVEELCEPADGSPPASKSDAA